MGLIDNLVCYTAVFWGRHAMLLPTFWGGALRDDSKNDCSLRSKRFLARFV